MMVLVNENNTDLLWQGEAGDIPSKFELFTVSFVPNDFCALLPGRIFVH